MKTERRTDNVAKLLSVACMAALLVSTAAADQAFLLPNQVECTFGWQGLGDGNVWIYGPSATMVRCSDGVYRPAGAQNTVSAQFQMTQARYGEGVTGPAAFDIYCVDVFQEVYWGERAVYSVSLLSVAPQGGTAPANGMGGTKADYIRALYKEHETAHMTAAEGAASQAPGPCEPP
jgi:hypothetical protein